MSIITITIIIDTLVAVDSDHSRCFSCAFRGMQKAFGRPAWVCSSCLKHQKCLSLRRWQSTAAAIAKPAEEFAPVTPATKEDDYSLRMMFDDQTYWRSVLSEKSRIGAVGFVQNQFLKEPQGWETYALTCVTKCRKIVDKVTNASTVSEYRAVARDLDRLSDLLCRVIDVSDFMRTLHNDKAIVDACTRSYNLAYKFMNLMNTAAGLKNKLREALAMPEVVSTWSAEEKSVAKMLMSDFVKSAIDMGGVKQRKFIDLHSEIAEAGPKFVTQMEPAETALVFKKSELHGLDPTVIKRLSTFTGKAKIPLFSPESYLALQCVHDPNVRRKLYLGLRQSSRKQIGRLERMLQKRAELAEVCGYPNYATMNLQDKMAKSPDAVRNFLISLGTSNQPNLFSELETLASLKRQLCEGEGALAVWDHAYFLNKHLHSTSSPASRSIDGVSSYFSVGTVIQGLSSIFDRLYGLRFVPVPVSSGETWHEDVRRLNVVSETDGLVGVIYCDLFSRPGKMQNPTHFTLRCSREIARDEIEECEALGQHPNDGLPTAIGPSRITGHQALYQLPVIALICDFDLPPSSGTRPSQTPPACLNINELITLFHETGHAVHSLLARTSLQTISGTRCATDFSELPSIIMESFATDPTCLALFGKHWQTGESPPPETFARMLASRHFKSQSNQYWNTQAQICMALFDLESHARSASKPIDSTAIYHSVWSQHAALPEPKGMSWQGFFGHLFTYGSSYYTYLFDTAIARRVWETTFQGGKNRGGLKRENGERFKEEVLRWGGGRDPWICIERLLGQGEGVLAQGGEMAMKKVGEWGTGDLRSEI